MNFTKHNTWLASTLALLITTAALTLSHGAVNITAEESGGNVVFTYSGTIDLTALSFNGTSTSQSYIEPAYAPQFSSQGDTADLTELSLYMADISGPAAYGSGSYTSANSSTGSAFEFSSYYVLLDPGYVSNADLNGTMTFDSTDFDTLGLTPGSYVWTIAESGETITMNIVPEPSSALLSGLGICGLLLRRRRAA